MEETISLQEIFATIRKRLGLIVLITIIATALSGMISYFVLTPVYEGSTQILVNQSNVDQQQGYQQSQVQANIDLVNTYSVIIKSPTILDKVIKQLNLDQTVDQLRDQLNVTSEQNSQVVNIAVDDPDPAKAVHIANTIATVFKKQVTDIMNVDNVSILSKANLDTDPKPVKPNPMLNMAIAFVVGLMVGVGLAFLLEYLDNTIKNEQDVEATLELPVLGVVTEMSAGEQRNEHSRVAKRQMGGQTFEA